MLFEPAKSGEFRRTTCRTTTIGRYSVKTDLRTALPDTQLGIRHVSTAERQERTDLSHLKGIPHENTSKR